MKVYYRILSIEETEGNIIVRYFTDFLSEEELATTRNIDGEIVYDANGYPEKCRTDYCITLYDKFNPSQEDVKQLIESQGPIEFFKLQQIIKSNSGYSLENVFSMVGQKNEFVHVDSLISPAANVENISN